VWFGELPGFHPIQQVKTQYSVKPYDRMSRGCYFSMASGFGDDRFSAVFGEQNWSSNIVQEVPILNLKK
jgi:hypothetical protein